MRFILDAQLPPRLAVWLRDRRHEARPARDLNLLSATDAEIWDRAQADHAIIVTKDEDFAEMAARLATGPQVLWVRTGNLLSADLIQRFEHAWPEIEKLLGQGSRLIEIR